MDLLPRLTSQLKARRVKNPEAVAQRLLEKRGHYKKGKLTKEGKKRQRMGAAGRAKERAARYANRNPSEYKYNSRTNLVRLK